MSVKSDSPIRAVAIFEEICRRHPGVGPGVRRTLERRIAGWRALHGPHRDVIFRQEHPPGRMGRERPSRIRSQRVGLRIKLDAIEGRAQNRRMRDLISFGLRSLA